MFTVKVSLFVYSLIELWLEYRKGNSNEGKGYVAHAPANVMIMLSFVKDATRHTTENVKGLAEVSWVSYIDWQINMCARRVPMREVNTISMLHLSG